MRPQEVIISGSSGEASSSNSTPGRSTSAPAIHIHDLLSANHVQSFKTSVAGPSTTSTVRTQNGIGGAIFAVQEGKSLLNIWAFQKDQLHLKIHLPEKPTSFSVSHNGLWAIAGSPTGQIYLWEISSGILLHSFQAHYRAIKQIRWTNDSMMFLSGSLDSSVHIYLISSLLEEGNMGQPYGTLRDHTLGITDIQVAKTGGIHGGRCWTASEDGAVKIWSLHPPFDLLTTFSLPQKQVPATISIDPTERFFYVGTSTGQVFHITLFRHKAGAQDRIEAVGGEGQASAPIRMDGAVISLKASITTLSLSLSSTYLMVGTSSGDIHIYALPSHQLLRIISSHSGPISYLATLLRPPDLVGTPGMKPDDYPLIEVKPFERIKANEAIKEAREVLMIINPKTDDDLIEKIKPITDKVVHAVSGGDGTRILELENENKRLKVDLERTMKMNERLWNNVVKSKLAESAPTT